MSRDPEQSLRDVDKNWFFKHSAVRDPEAAWEKWRDWLGRTRSSDPWAWYHKLLEIAGGVSRNAVKLYDSQSDWRELSPHTLWDLDTISSALDVTVPRRDGAIRRPRLDLRGTWHIALLCELAGIPSPRFHIEVLRSLVEAQQTGNISVAIHAAKPTAADFHASLQRMVRLERPEGIIWFRVTPDTASLEILNGIPNLCPRVPAVVVHGSMQEYQPPVLGHVFPDQSGLADAIEHWARKLQGADVTSGEVAVVAMARESGGLTSIRNQRVDSIHAGIGAAGFQPRLLDVPDYSTANAEGVLRRCPHALGYVCLSDEIAVGVKNLLTAGGRHAAENVLGFDQSSLASRCGIPSFDQSLDRIGEATWSLFLDLFRREDNASWPHFRPMPVPLVLG